MGTMLAAAGECIPNRTPHPRTEESGEAQFRRNVKGTEKAIIGEWWAVILPVHSKTDRPQFYCGCDGRYKVATEGQWLATRG